MSLPRSTLVRPGRRRVFKWRLPPDFDNIAILVSLESSLRFWLPKIDFDVYVFPREFVKPGNVAWDVGANVCLLSSSAAKRSGASGRVMAIEPDIWLADLLHPSAAIQPPSSAPVQVIPTAMSDSIGAASFNISKSARSSKYIAEETSAPFKAHNYIMFDRESHPRQVVEKAPCNILAIPREGI